MMNNKAIKFWHFNNACLELKVNSLCECVFVFVWVIEERERGGCDKINVIVTPIHTHPQNIKMKN